MKWTALTAALAILGTIPAGATTVFEDWNDLDLDGWQPNTTRTVNLVYPSGGLNDSAYLRTSQTATGFMVAGARHASAPWVGDYATADYRKVGCQLKFFVGQIDAVVFRARYLDPSHGGWHIPLTQDFSPGDWRYSEIVFDPTWSDAEALAAGWVQEPNSPTFQETMANVYTAEIRIDGSLDLEVGIDNLILGSEITCRIIQLNSDFDLDTGYHVPPHIGFSVPTTDIKVTTPEGISTHFTIKSHNGREYAVLKGAPLETVSYADVVTATFTTDNYPGNIEYDDTVLVLTDEGRYFKVGRGVNDGIGNADFCYTEILPATSSAGNLDGMPATTPVRMTSVHPNPLNPRTRITFNVDREQRVDLAIHDLRGRKVRYLASEVFSRGDHTVSWNGNDDQGHAMPSGVYLVRLTSETGFQTRKMMLVR